MSTEAVSSFMSKRIIRLIVEHNMFQLENLESSSFLMTLSILMTKRWEMMSTRATRGSDTELALRK
jgi:hypothetical protein